MGVDLVTGKGKLVQRRDHLRLLDSHFTWLRLERFSPVVIILTHIEA